MIKVKAKHFCIITYITQAYLYLYFYINYDMATRFLLGPGQSTYLRKTYQLMFYLIQNYFLSTHKSLSGV